MSNRAITRIVVHCSATREGQDFTAHHIKQWHLDRGFSDIGYHWVIRLDGSIEAGRKESQIGAHASGFNASSIGVCYIGGLGRDGESKDTRTAAQKATLLRLLKELKVRYPKAKILGHRDLSPDKNGNGKVDPFEYLKDCPCFDAVPEYASL